MICKYFLAFRGGLFVLLIVSFATQKLFSLIQSHLFISAFVSFHFGVRPKKSSPRLRSRGLLFVFFFPRSFIVLGLTCKTLIHFELTLVFGVTQWSSFILSHVGVQFPHHHLLKILSFPHSAFFTICRKLTGHLCMNFCVGSLFCPSHQCVCVQDNIILF